MVTLADFPKDLSGDAVLPFSLHGIALEIPRSILTPELWMAFAGGYYEGSEIAALRQMVRPNDVVLELGAGVGFISAFLFRSLGAASVCAVEANRDLLPVIRRTHEINGVSATVFHGVAARSDGLTRFHEQDAFWASSIVPLPNSRVATLPGIDIARLIREVRPNVLVVDIEGGELDLFCGLDLPGVRSLVVEVHQPQIGGAGVSRCFAALQDAGFAYDPDGSSGSNVAFTRFSPKRSRIGAAWSAFRRM
jgi:FkbM family methyltransferase